MFMFVNNQLTLHWYSLLEAGNGTSCSACITNANPISFFSLKVVENEHNHMSREDNDLGPLKIRVSKACRIIKCVCVCVCEGFAVAEINEFLQVIIYSMHSPGEEEHTHSPTRAHTHAGEK